MTTGTRGRVVHFLIQSRMAIVLVIFFAVSAHCKEVVVGCTGDYYFPPTLNQVSMLIKSWNPDFIISAGDNVLDGYTYDQTAGQYYHEYIHPYYGSYGEGATTNRFFPAIGQHDWRAFSIDTNRLHQYLEFFTLPGNERYYSYRYGVLEMFAVSSYFEEPDGNTADSIQARWLRDRLARSTAIWKLVYLHTSPYSSGSRYGSRSGTNLQWPYKAWGATAVISARDNIYERVMTNDLVYFVNGMGGNAFIDPITNIIAGSEVRYNEAHGALRIAATCNRITFQFYNISNDLIDTYAITNVLANGSPTIVDPPQEAIVLSGRPAAFSAAICGTEPLSYQWQKNEEDLLTSTNDVLEVPHVGPEQEGWYQLIVSNALGVTRSEPVQLKIARHPLFLEQPRNSTNRPGTTATFSVKAEGIGPLRYQWQYRGTNLVGETNMSLVLTNVQWDQRGPYWVLVTDDFGTLASQPADLRVLVRPTFILQPLSQSAVPGQDVTFSIAASGTVPMTFNWRLGASNLTSMVVDGDICFLTLTNVQVSNAGTYRAYIANEVGFSSTLSSAAVLTILADADHDGIADVWEEAHGFSSATPADADVDDDGDGLSNRKEYLLGTDPKNAESTLQLAVQFALSSVSGNVQLFFGAQSNRTYTIQSSDLKDSPVWKRVIDVPATSSNRIIHFITNTASVSNAAQFYRLVSPRVP